MLCSVNTIVSIKQLQQPDSLIYIAFAGFRGTEEEL
jgi:hypothetical protein